MLKFLEFFGTQDARVSLSYEHEINHFFSIEWSNYRFASSQVARERAEKEHAITLHRIRSVALY